MGKPRQATPGGRRSYSEEFKREAVRLIVEQKYSFRAAATAAGVSEQSLRGWHAKYAPAPSPCGEGATLDELRAENQRLRPALRRAELEREILKKADAFIVQAKRAYAESGTDPHRVEHEAWISYAHVLLASNEFLHVD